ncbi:MAG: type II toxin-antitoxin system VapB family antitoxin [Deltaproteobacteria bacterium]|nr:type II toxin-antitoxin system VapB family antitoxin [Deltaproteobacteria bacterium]
MRTTLLIDDAVFRRAKEAAARSGTTLGGLVEQALREFLRERRVSAAEPFRMQTYGGRRRKVRHEPADFARELDAEDAASLE